MRIVLIALALLLPAAAMAGPSAQFLQITASRPVALRTDRAYILYRTPKVDGVTTSDTIFLREPDDEKGLESVPNLTRVRASQPYAETASEKVYLIEAMPGRYVIAGQADKTSPITETCFCMGTLRFAAKPGIVTDLGYLLTDAVASKSPIPELRELTGRGARINGSARVLAGAVRPVTSEALVPGPLRDWPRAPADFRAVGKIENRFAVGINRLAPLAGVLAYDEDRVIDLKAQPTS